MDGVGYDDFVISFGLPLKPSFSITTDPWDERYIWIHLAELYAKCK